MLTKFVVNEPYIICLLIDRKLKKKFKGVAKCLPGDTFVEKTGKEIAKLKAEMKREDFRIRSASGWINYCYRIADNMANDLANRMNIYEKNYREKYRALEELIR